MDVLINSILNQSIIEDWAWQLMQDADEAKAKEIYKNLKQLGLFGIAKKLETEIEQNLDSIQLKSEQIEFQKKRFSKAIEVDNNIEVCFI